MPQGSRGLKIQFFCCNNHVWFVKCENWVCEISRQICSFSPIPLFHCFSCTIATVTLHLSEWKNDDNIYSKGTFGASCFQIANFVWKAVLLNSIEVRQYLAIAYNWMLDLFQFWPWYISHSVHCTSAIWQCSQPNLRASSSAPMPERTNFFSGHFSELMQWMVFCFNNSWCLCWWLCL